MPFKYAVFTVMCPEYDLEQTAAMAKAVGFDGLEWRVYKASPEPITQFNYWRANRSTVDVDHLETTLPRAKQLADQHGLAMPVLGTYLGCHDHAAVERVMRVAAEVGVRKLRVGSPGYDGSRPYPELYEQAVRDYAAVEKLAAKYGVQACAETHPGIITPSMGLMHRLVSHFDPKHIGVIYDPANFVNEGFENYQMGLELVGPYLAHVHAKNCMWVPAGQENDVAKFELRTVPGPQGQVDWRKVLGLLKKMGYEGWISFEDFSDGETKTKLTDSLAYFKKLEAAL